MLEARRESPCHWRKRSIRPGRRRDSPRRPWRTLWGATRQAVSKWETGKSVPDTENIRRMAQVLAVSADYFLGEAPAPESALGDPAILDAIDRVSQRMGLLFFLIGVAAIALCSVVFLIRSLLGESHVYATIQVTDFTIAAVLFLLSLIGGCSAFLLSREKK